MATSKPLKWHGGKHYLASRIVAMMPPHVHYVEPFFGGGAVLFAKPPELVENHSEVVNDLNSELANFWRVLRDVAAFDIFRRAIEATPFSSETWEQAAQSSDWSIVERAVNFFIRYRQSRQGLGGDFATMSRTRTRRGMNEQVASWLSAIEGLPAAHSRLKRVVIFNEDAIEVIRREDGPDTFFYCDPPYVRETRSALEAYECEMSDERHFKLLDALTGIEGKFLLSGYRCGMYDDHALSVGWDRVDIQIDNKASGSKVKQLKTECLWANYDLEPSVKGGE